MKQNIADEIKSSVMGFAVGDALGVPVEFLGRNTLKGNPVSEMKGYGSHKVPAGTWSDDTSLMIATMDSIIDNNDINYDDIMYKFYEWVANAKYTATDELFDIGIATSNAINNYRSGEEPTKCGMTGIHENGNGSLMRILPIVFYSYINELSEIEEIELINNVSSLTHQHEISRLGCKIFSDYIKNILDGKSKEEALDNLKENTYERYYSKESINYYKRIFNGKLKKASEEEIKSTGFVVDTLEACIWSTINSNNYEEAVAKSVNLGDDTDTVGAITGSINGLIYGYNSIPQRWINKLQKKDYLDELSNSFSQTLLKKNNKLSK